MPRGRIESASAVGSSSQKLLSKDGTFYPIPVQVGTIKVIIGGNDPQLPPGRIIPFLSGKKVDPGDEHDFVKISSMLPTALLVD